MPTVPDAKVEKFVSQDDTTIHLGNVWFDAEGQRVAATDGHRLVVARVKSHENEVSGYIPVLAFETIRKMITRHNKECDFPPGELITMKAFSDQIIIANEWTHEVYTIQRPTFGNALKFPAFDKVIPKAKGKATVTVDSKYLATFCKELGGDASGISLWIKDSDNSVLLSVADSDAIGVLMPMKYETEAADVLTKVKPLTEEIPSPHPVSAQISSQVSAP